MMPSTMKVCRTYEEYLAQYPKTQQYPEPLSLEDYTEVHAPMKPMVSGGINLRPGTIIPYDPLKGIPVLAQDLATFVPVKDVAITDTPLGIKYDSDKPKWSLMPKGVIAQVVEVMTIGAKKYSPDNWMHVAPVRYYDAMNRHVDHWRNGETNDQETGKHHLAHAICCLIFMLWHDQKDVKKT